MKRKTEDEQDDDAVKLLGSPTADRFARALDRCGWMITLQPEARHVLAAWGAEELRWIMSTPGPCPAWAAPHGDAVSKPKPALALIDGDKPDAEPS